MSLEHGERAALGEDVMALWLAGPLVLMLGASPAVDPCSPLSGKARPDRSAWAYLWEGWRTPTSQLAPEVGERWSSTWPWQALYPTSGAAFWAPSMVLSDLKGACVPASSRKLALLAYVLAWLPWVTTLAGPLVWVPGLGCCCVASWWAGAGFSVLMFAWIIPRALALSYSDAYGGGIQAGDGAPP